MNTDKLSRVVKMTHQWLQENMGRELGDSLIDRLAEAIGERPTKIQWGAAHLYITMANGVTISVEK